MSSPRPASVSATVCGLSLHCAGVLTLEACSTDGDGANELVIGEAIKGFPRKDVVICSKVLTVVCAQYSKC